MKMYNSDDCYNLEKVQDDAKKVKAKDVFENYKPPKGKGKKQKPKPKPKPKKPKGY